MSILAPLTRLTEIEISPFSYCDEDCVDFIGAPYLDVYTGPYVNPEPPTKEAPTELDNTDNHTAPINETKPESSQVNDCYRVKFDLIAFIKIFE